LWAELSAAGAEKAGTLPLIYIGTPGPRRKAVCHVVEGQAVASIVKVPLGESAGEAILHEADVLDSLARLHPGVAAPRLISVDTGRRMSRQSWLPGRQSGRMFGTAHSTYLEGLQTSRSLSVADAVDAALAREGQGGGELHTSARKILGRARAASVVRECVVHGDFAAWNLKLSGGVLAACDWEESRIEGLPLQDAAHFFVNDAFLFGAKGNPLQQMLSSPAVGALIASMGIDAATARALLLYYCGATALVRLQRGETDYAKYLVGLASDLMEQG
jgi:hypothetical protein